MDTMHPFLESTTVGVDVLDGVDARDDAIPAAKFKRGGIVPKTVLERRSESSPLARLYCAAPATGIR